jgi:hypothetical protein
MATGIAYSREEIRMLSPFGVKCLLAADRRPELQLGALLAGRLLMRPNLPYQEGGCVRDVG